jgi:hypothetical protein
MIDIGSIIIIVIVFRIIFLVLRAWWNGDSRNDYRRDR